MIDVYMIRKKNVPTSYNQDDLEQDSKDFLTNSIQYRMDFHRVKRYKNSTLGKDLNKIIKGGEHPIIMIGYVGFDVPKFFDDKVIEKFGMNDQIGMMGFKILDVNSNIIDAGIESPLRAMPIWRSFMEDCNDMVAKTEDVNVFIDGKLCLIKRKDFEAVDGFDPVFNHLWAVDISFRIGQSGKKVLYSPIEITQYNYFDTDLEALTDMYKDDVMAFTQKFVDNLASGIVLEGKTNGK
jgi:hypothetical protein